MTADSVCSGELKICTLTGPAGLVPTAALR